VDSQNFIENIPLKVVKMANANLREQNLINLTPEESKITVIS
jgi:hypothetical protein